MNDIETLKQKIIDDLSDIRDKDILEYIAKRMGLHADVARSGKPYLFDPESGCYANDETIDVTLSTYPVTYSPDGHITIAAVQLVVYQNDNGYLLCGKDVEIEIKSAL